MTAPTDTRPRGPAWLQCAGKEPFRSPQLAAKVARRANAAKKRGRIRERHVEPYSCPHCGWFHLGGKGKYR